MPKYTLEQLKTDGLPFVMAYLMMASDQHSTLTYGQIAERLAPDLGVVGPIFSTQIGQPVGALMDRIHASYPNAPLINALAVNQATGFASEGVDEYLAAHFATSLKKIRTRTDYKQSLLNEALAEVYAHKEWLKIAHRLFGDDHPAFQSLRNEEGTETDKSTSPGQPRGGDAESPEHKALKERIASDPTLVGAPSKVLASETEFSLKSGDEVDVCITSAEEIRLVEVKSRRSNMVDFERGIYQCVKYRAVYEAMRLAVGVETTVVAVLATETILPARLKELAKKLGISTKVVQR